jgi:chromate reductase
MPTRPGVPERTRRERQTGESLEKVVAGQQHGRAVPLSGVEGARARGRKEVDLRILAFGGSLRDASFNRTLLVEAAAMAPPGIEIDLGILPVIGALPLYDQDIAGRGFPPEAVELKEALRTAEGLLIASPEYNWGIPGYLKNALDWASRPAVEAPIVFGDLPVALIGAGGLSGTRFAQTAWLSVFRYLKMRPWFGGPLFVEHSQERFDAKGRLTDEPTRERLRAVVAGFAEHCTRLPRRTLEDRAASARP